MLLKRHLLVPFAVTTLTFTVAALGTAQAAPHAGAINPSAKKKTTSRSRHQQSTTASDDAASAPLSAVNKTESGRHGIGLVDGPLSGLRLRPLLGYNFISPKSYNNRLGQIAAASKIQSDFKIGGAMNFGMAAEYPVYDGFYAGLRLDYISSSTESASVGTAGSGFTMQAGVNALPIMATASYIRAVAPHMALGATVGAGVPLFYRAYLDISNSNVASNPNGSLTYSSTPIAGLISACGEYEINRSVAMRLETGYRFLSSSNLKLNENYGSERAGSPLQDASGANLKVDASSLLTTLSLVVTL